MEFLFFIFFDVVVFLFPAIWTSLLVRRAHPLESERLKSQSSPFGLSPLPLSSPLPLLSSSSVSSPPRSQALRSSAPFIPSVPLSVLRAHTLTVQSYTSRTCLKAGGQRSERRWWRWRRGGGGGRRHPATASRPQSYTGRAPCGVPYGSSKLADFSVSFFVPFFFFFHLF